MTNRRHFLRASGVLLSLPYLETFAAPAPVSKLRRRTVAINFGLGLHGPNLFPEKSGKEFELTPYLRELKSSEMISRFFPGRRIPVSTAVTPQRNRS